MKVEDHRSLLFAAVADTRRETLKEVSKIVGELVTVDKWKVGE